ncbi:MAG: (Fe-S)-binding protein [Candidatus Aenigmatarchaeota archaeon]
MLFGNVLYYPGCMSKFVVKNLKENYEKILRKIGIDFIELKDLEVCCGSPVLNSGYFKEFEDLVKKNFSVFKEHSVKKIITGCPACYKTFKKEYPKFLKFDIKIEHVTQTILEGLEKKKLKLRKIGDERVTYHDPCHLGRYSGIYEEPRKIIEKLGFDLIEMEFSKEKAFCCGGGGGVRSNYPELAEEMARERIKQAEKTGAKILITTCPLCYFCFKEFSEKIEVFEISEMIVKSLEI